MISFEKFILNNTEKESFTELIKTEIDNSKRIEEFLYNNRKKDRKKYYYMQKNLTLK